MRIAELLGDLSIGTTPLAKDHSPELESTPPELNDEERSRLPTAEASCIADFNSSLDLFLYAERLAQSDSADPTHLGPVSYTHLTLPTILLV